jgi:hypothetical protein
MDTCVVAEEIEIAVILLFTNTFPTKPIPEKSDLLTKVGENCTGSCRRWHIIHAGQPLAETTTDLKHACP